MLGFVSEIGGGLLGWALGERGRAHLLERRYRRMVAGKDVAVGVLAHFVGAPEWRETAGVLRRRAGRVTWSPRLWARVTSFTVVPPRRWTVGVLALDNARVVGTRTKRSAARGDRVLIELAAIPEISYLAVRPEALRVAQALLRAG
jgi:hypothetical protein